jgi:hypothetical protein
MSIQIEKSEYSSSPYSLLWFDFNNEIIELNVNMLCNSSQMKLYALTKEEQISPISISKSAIALKDTYSGSVAAVLPSFEADLNNDGIMDTVNLYAKADTIFTQGFVPVRTNFTDIQIPMEIHNLGRGNIEVLYNQKPLLNKELQVFSNRGLNKVIKTDAQGVLKLNDIRDLREGTIVVYTENNVYHIASYTVESSALFSKNHYKSLIPLIKVLCISAVIIIILTVLRMVLSIKGRKKQGLLQNLY